MENEIIAGFDSLNQVIGFVLGGFGLGAIVGFVAGVLKHTGR